MLNISLLVKHIIFFIQKYFGKKVKIFDKKDENLNGF
jgi:hypothetical protein